MAGFYCPANTPAEFCPRGFYCPNPVTRIECPEKYYCPRGSQLPRGKFDFEPYQRKAEVVVVVLLLLPDRVCCVS